MPCVDIWFEAVPSPADADAARVRADVERVSRAARAGASRILVPEVVDTGHRAIDNVAFAAQVRNTARCPTGIALVTAHRTHEEVAQRIEAADAQGVDTVLLVGPASRREHSGPSVAEALESHATGRHIGVVTIPTRRRQDLDEPERIIRKQRAGARFAVSQILFEAETALRLRRDYVAKLDGEPIPFYYSLAPVSRQKDLDFMAGLGAHIPDDVRAHIEAAPDRAQAGRTVALEVARRLIQAHADEGLGPIGFCISHVLFPNVDEAIRLLEAVARLEVAATR